jgi:hypothetical protein
MLASPAVVSHMNARSPFWRGIGPGLPGGVRPGSGSWAGSSWSLARGGGCPGCRPSILMAAVGARGQHQTRCSCRWSMPPSSRTRSASPSSGRWSPTPRPSGRSAAVQGGHRPAAWPLRRRPGAALGERQANAGRQATRSSPAAAGLGPRAGSKPGGGRGGAADGGCVPWPGRRPRPSPRPGGPSPGPGAACRHRPGRHIGAP